MFVRCRDLGTKCRRLHLLSLRSHSGRSAGCCGQLRRAEAELKAAAARTRAELAKSVAQTALDIADRRAGVNRMQWIASCAFVLGVFP